MKPPAFVYERAASMEEAVAALAEHGDEAMVLAGGQSLVPMLNMRLAAPTAVIDVFHLEELRYMRRSDEALTLGAMTTQRQLELADPDLLARFEVLREAAGWVGHYPIRTRSTVGGSLAHADPAAELPLLATLLDAHVTLVRRGSQRVVPAADFFEGFLSTAREPEELLTEVRFPRPAGQAVITEHARRHGDFGIVLAAATLVYEVDRCSAVRIALGGVGPVPQRLRDIEAQLEGAQLADGVLDDVAELVRRVVDPRSDAHASAEYRRKLAAALVRRCLVRLRGSADFERRAREG